MPVKYSRYSKRRYYKRRYGRTKFSRYHTYRYRSSKAQAKQIYSLNKKINRVYRNVKPEVQIFNSSMSFLNGSLTTTGATYTYGCVPIVSQQLGIFNGKYARIKSFSLFGMLENMGNENTSRTCNIGLRLVFFSLKSEKWGVTPIEDIIPNINRISSTDFDNAYYFNSPLQAGFSTRYRLLKDKRYVLRVVDGTSKNIKVSMKYPFSLRSSDVISNTGSSYYPKNTVYCAWMLLNLGDDTSFGKNNAGFSLWFKLAYTDDNYTPSNSKSKEVDTNTVDTEQVDKEPEEDALNIFRMDEDK